MGYMCTKFGVDTPSSFPFRAWTQTQTHTYTQSNSPSQTTMITLPTHRLLCNNDNDDDTVICKLLLLYKS